MNRNHSYNTTNRSMEDRRIIQVNASTQQELPSAETPSTVIVVAPPEERRNSNSNGDARFPVVLHKMLDAVEKDGLTHIVSWQPHGRCLLVHQPSVFVATILARWFRQSKWSSFQRQLNIYGFQRITSGPDKSGYYHRLFLRGHEDLAQEIPRTQVKGTGPRRSTSLRNEPNFYQMPLLSSKPRCAATGLVNPQQLPQVGGPSPIESTVPSIMGHSLAINTAAHDTERTQGRSAHDILVSMISERNINDTSVPAVASIQDKCLFDSWTTSTMPQRSVSTPYFVGAPATTMMSATPAASHSSLIDVRALLGQIPNDRRTNFGSALSTGSWKDALLSELLSRDSTSLGANSNLLLQLEANHQRQRELEAATAALDAISLPPTAPPLPTLEELIQGDVSSLSRRILELRLLSDQMRSNH